MKCEPSDTVVIVSRLRELRQIHFQYLDFRVPPGLAELNVLYIKRYLKLTGLVEVILGGHFREQRSRNWQPSLNSPREYSFNTRFIKRSFTAIVGESAKSLKITAIRAKTCFRVAVLYIIPSWHCTIKSPTPSACRSYGWWLYFHWL